MSISSVTKRAGMVLSDSMKDFISVRLTARRNEMRARGCSWPLEDEFIEGLLDDLLPGMARPEPKQGRPANPGPDAFQNPFR